MTSGEFLHHAPCPNCGSKDNLAVYDDHTYCFGCRVHTRTNFTPSKSKARKEQSHVREFPADYSVDIPPEGLQWLLKYHLSPVDISKHRIGWSQNGFPIRQGAIQYSPLMIFPIYDPNGTLLMWQARYFGKEKLLPKYWTVGAKDILHILGKGTSSICLVEDVLSSIRVSKHVDSMPLFGSTISTELLVRLYKLGYTDLIIWLDKDKGNYAKDRAVSAKVLFPTTRAIITELDPKEYTHEQIRQQFSS